MKLLFSAMLAVCVLAFGNFTANASPINAEKDLPKATLERELSKPSLPSVTAIVSEPSKPEIAIDNAISTPSKYSIANINAEKAAAEKKASREKTVYKAKKHTKSKKRSMRKRTGNKTHKKEAATAPDTASGNAGNISNISNIDDAARQ